MTEARRPLLPVCVLSLPRENWGDVSDGAAFVERGRDELQPER